MDDRGTASPGFGAIVICDVVMAPRAGFEPATNRLTAGCSTTELPGNNARHAVMCSAYNKAVQALQSSGERGRSPREKGVGQARNRTVPKTGVPNRRLQYAGRRISCASPRLQTVLWRARPESRDPTVGVLKKLCSSGASLRIVCRTRSWPKSAICIATGRKSSAPSFSLLCVRKPDERPSGK